MINNSHQNPERASAPNSSELSWLAFCYIANELDAEKRREFEIRLEHDQTAREAVVQAFDNAWMLDQALSAQAPAADAATCELPQPAAKRAGRSNGRKSKRLWPIALLGGCAAILLAMVLPQLYNKPAEVAVTSASTTQGDLTNTSMSLAETWADSDWDIESAVEIAGVETNLTACDIGDQRQEIVRDDDPDDWMTATLIDMAEEPNSLPLQSGS